MLRFTFQRLMQAVPILIGVSLIVFFLLRLSGDPVRLLLPDDATAVEVQELRDHLGLNEPIPVQYALFLGGLLKGDLGTSLRYSGQPALQIILERLPTTGKLAAAAIAIAILFSLAGGILAAVFENKWPDFVVTLFSVVGQAMPNFWLGIMLILVFAVSLDWLPVSGRGTVFHMFLPAVTLAAPLTAILTRLLRAAILEVKNKDYVRTAKAKGLARRTLLVKHILRNAVLSYITILGLQVAKLMAGAVVTEQVFAYPGLGLLTVQAINARDMALVQGIVLVTATIVMVANLLVDLAYALINPQVQFA